MVYCFCRILQQYNYPDIRYQPFFIFMKSNDDNSEYRYYYFNGKLIRYIDENGEVSDYEDGTDIIGSDLYEWADAM